MATQTYNPSAADIAAMPTPTVAAPTVQPGQTQINGVIVGTPTGTPLNTPPVAPISGPVPVGQTTTQPPLNLGATVPPVGGVDTAGATVAGAAQTAKTTADYLKANEVDPSLTPITTENKALVDSYNSLLESDTGKAATTASAETAAGLPDMKKQLADLNAQILQKNAEYAKLSTDTEANSNFKGSFSAKDTQIKRQQAADIGLLQARALGLQGNIQAAQDAVSRAVDLKYAGIEEQLAIKEKQLNAIAPLLSAEQQKVATAQAQKLTDEKQAIADQKEEAKTNLNTVVQLGIHTNFVNENGKFFDARTGQVAKDIPTFLKMAGVTSIAEAYAKHLITDTSSIPQKQDTQVIEVNGRKVLINSQTGATVKDLGSASSGLNTSAIGFTPTDKQALLAVGFNAQDINNIQNDVNKYGIDHVIQGLPANQANAIKKVLGGAPAAIQFLTPAYFKKQFSDLNQAAIDAGFISRSGGIGGSGIGAKDYGDTEAFLADTMNKVQLYRNQGYTDDQILKLFPQ